MEELIVLKALLNQERYHRYYTCINNLNFEQEIKNILTVISSYYSEYPDTKSISEDELQAYFYLKYPLYKTNDSYEIIFNNLRELEITNDDIILKTIANLVEKYYASVIVEELTQVLSGSKFGLISKIPDIVDRYQTKIKTSEQDLESNSKFVDSTLAELLTDEVMSSGIKWRLDSINQDVGDLRGGSLGHVFARPDTGKTSFMASEVTNMAKQLTGDEVIVWFNNEERGTKVFLRTYSAMLNKTKDEIAEDPIKYEKEFRDLGGDKIKIYDSAIISVYDIEQILKQYNVRVLVIDQGDKIKFRGDKELAGHERLKVLYGMFREIAKEYNCDIITAGQASSDAEGRQYLDLSMMDNSKTGKPGELDYAIGIGYCPEEGKESIRYIHIAKNKMKNGVHGRHIVVFDPTRARYSDLSYTPPKQGVSNGFIKNNPGSLVEHKQDSSKQFGNIEVFAAAKSGVY